MPTITDADWNHILYRYDHIAEHPRLTRQMKAGYLAAACMLDPNLPDALGRMTVVAAAEAILTRLPE